MKLAVLMLTMGLAAVLMLGCLSGIKEKQQADGSLGDADISSGQLEDDVEVPSEDLLPPPPDADSGSGSTLDLADIDVDISEEDPMIFEEDIIEPP